MSTRPMRLMAWKQKRAQHEIVCSFNRVYNVYPTDCTECEQTVVFYEYSVFKQRVIPIIPIQKQHSFIFFSLFSACASSTVLYLLVEHDEQLLVTLCLGDSMFCHEPLLVRRVFV